MFRAVGKLAAVNGIAQVGQLAFQPLLARLYSPDQFGFLGQAIALSSIIAVIGTLQTHNYLVVADAHYKPRQIEMAGRSFANLVSVLIAILGINIWQTIFKTTLSIESLFTIVVLLNLMCHSNMLRGAHTEAGDITGIMRYTTIRALSVVVSQVALGSLGVDLGMVYGLIIGELVAQTSSGSSRQAKAWISLIPSSLGRVLAPLKHRLATLGTWTLQDLASVAAAVSPLYLMGAAYDLTTGGQFALAHKMTWAPMLLAAQSISPILFKNFAVRSPSELRSTILVNPLPTFLLFAVLAPMFLFLSPFLFQIIFGVDWGMAASMSGPLVISATAFLLSFPYRLVLRVRNRQGVQLFIDMATFVSILALFFCAGIDDSMTTVQILSGLYVAQNVSVILVARRILGRSL